MTDVALCGLQVMPSNETCGYHPGVAKITVIASDVVLHVGALQIAQQANALASLGLGSIKNNIP